MRRSVRTWRESTGYIQGETTETTLSCVRGVQEPEWLQTKNVMADACLFIYSFKKKSNSLYPLQQQQERQQRAGK